MNFVVMTGSTGHGTFTANEGLPTIILGPGTAAAPVAARNFVFGANSLSQSAGNDFNVSVLDDPQSYAALMTPLDIPTMALFLQEQQIPVQLILPLFINRIRIIPDGTSTAYEFDPERTSGPIVFIYCIPKGGDGGLTCDETKYYLDDPPERIASKLAECQAGIALCVNPSMFVYGYLYVNGLVFQTPAGGTPLQSGQLPYRICFDPVGTHGPAKSFTDFLRSHVTFKGRDGEHFLNGREFLAKFSDNQGAIPSKPSFSGTNQKNICDDKLTWMQPAVLTTGTASQSSKGGTNIPSSLCLNGSCAASKTQETSTGNKTHSYSWAYEFYDPHDHATIQFTTRSTRGMYRYLGQLVAQQERGLPAPLFMRGLSDDWYLFRVIINGGSLRCFTTVTYDGVSYCIPTNAYNSKYIISLLHELTNLQTKPNTAQQPNTGTVRVTP